MHNNIFNETNSNVGGREEALNKVALIIKKKQRKLYAVGIIFFSIAMSILIFRKYQSSQDHHAQDEIFQAVYYFEEEAFDKALEGDGVYSGFLDVIQRYPFTQTANLAYFYAGICYMHKKEYDQAIFHLLKYNINDFLLQACVWGLLGDAYVEKQDYVHAVKYYMKASNYKPNSIFSPRYLKKAALVYEILQDYQSALNCYQIVIKQYAHIANTRPGEYATVRKHICRLEGLLLIKKSCAKKDGS